MDKRIVVASLASAIVGGLVGGAVTYLTVKKTFAERAQRDIDDVKKEYHDRFDGKRVVNVYSDVVDPEVTTKATSNITTEDIRIAREFVENLNYQQEAAEEAEETILNIYDRQVENPPGEEVVHKLLIGYDADALRAARKPYLISEDDFTDTETEWDKISITYFEDDDVLTDERDNPVDEIDRLIGEQHLEFFGIKSGGDKNIVFIRNPQISTDFEVTRNLGSYTEMVLGIPKGSENVGTRRMRAGDDG